MNPSGHINPLSCSFTNSTCKKTPGLCNNTVICNSPGDLCQTTWTNHSGVVEVELKGCWSNKFCSFSENKCIGKRTAADVYFCCCTGSRCNDLLEISSAVSTTDKSEIPTHPPLVLMQDNNAIISSATIAFLIVLSVAVILAYLCFRKRKSFRSELPVHYTDFDPAICEQSPLTAMNYFKAELIEKKGSGRFGDVWKATCNDSIIAVKVFPVNDKSFEAEKDFYRLIEKHENENILRYYGYDHRRANEKSPEQLWLLTEYHEHGSLYDYLKANVVSWQELLKISEGIASGLSFLHEEIKGAAHGAACKPSVTHRDLKSKNILLKDNLTPCIGDFGLAMKFDPDLPVGDTFPQVGTRRYMAPEVLDSAINFNRDSFLRIDIYAFGLVLWELASRCIDHGGSHYQLPFVEELGSPTPALDSLQRFVCRKNGRPKFKEHWLKHEGMKTFRDTVEEAWDTDPEARLTSPCIHERIKQLQLQSDSMMTKSQAHPSTKSDEEHLLNDLTSSVSSGYSGGSSDSTMPLHLSTNQVVDYRHMMHGISPNSSLNTDSSYSSTSCSSVDAASKESSLSV